MKTNHAFMARELPEEEMQMLYSLLGKAQPATKDPHPKFRFNFGSIKRLVYDEIICPK